jgi:hypothetical protein
VTIWKDRNHLPLHPSIRGALWTLQMGNGSNGSNFLEVGEREKGV